MFPIAVGPLVKAVLANDIALVLLYLQLYTTETADLASTPPAIALPNVILVLSNASPVPQAAFPRTPLVPTAMTVIFLFVPNAILLPPGLENIPLVAASTPQRVAHLPSVLEWMNSIGTLKSDLRARQSRAPADKEMPLSTGAQTGFLRLAS